jgi:hypothetical protein
MKKFFVSEVKRLSQEEGLFDSEIAELFGCHRTTITRCRERNSIPRPNLLNRKDKQQTCRRCKTVTYIRRHERRSAYCPDCKEIRLQERAEQKRAYMRTYKKK